MASVLAAVVLIGGVVALSGAVVPRISQSSGGGGGGGGMSRDELGRPRELRSEITQTFHNESRMPITITGVSAEARGFSVVSVDAHGRSFPHTLGPGEAFTLEIGLDITDCEIAQTEKATVLFEVQHWWGPTIVSADQEVDSELWQESFIQFICGL